MEGRRQTPIPRYAEEDNRSKNTCCAYHAPIQWYEHDITALRNWDERRSDYGNWRIETKQHYKNKEGQAREQAAGESIRSGNLNYSHHEPIQRYEHDTTAQHNWEEQQEDYANRRDKKEQHYSDREEQERDNKEEDIMHRRVEAHIHPLSRKNTERRGSNNQKWQSEQRMDNTGKNTMQKRKRAQDHPWDYTDTSEEEEQYHSGERDQGLDDEAFFFTRARTETRGDIREHPGWGGRKPDARIRIQEKEEEEFRIYKAWCEHCREKHESRDRSRNAGLENNQRRKWEEVEGAGRVWPIHQYAHTNTHPTLRHRPDAHTRTDIHPGNPTTGRDIERTPPRSIADRREGRPYINETTERHPIGTTLQWDRNEQDTHNRDNSPKHQMENQSKQATRVRDTHTRYTDHTPTETTHKEREWRETQEGETREGCTAEDWEETRQKREWIHRIWTGPFPYGPNVEQREPKTCAGNTSKIATRNPLRARTWGVPERWEKQERRDNTRTTQQYPKPREYSSKWEIGTAETRKNIEDRRGIWREWQQMEREGLIDTTANGHHTPPTSDTREKEDAATQQEQTRRVHWRERPRVEYNRINEGERTPWDGWAAQATQHQPRDREKYTSSSGYGKTGGAERRGGPRTATGREEERQNQKEAITHERATSGGTPTGPPQTQQPRFHPLRYIPQPQPQPPPQPPLTPLERPIPPHLPPPHPHTTPHQRHPAPQHNPPPLQESRNPHRSTKQTTEPHIEEQRSGMYTREQQGQ